MTDDTPKVEPALSEAEWKGLSVPHIAQAIQYAAANGEWAQIVALANALLPDGHPAKITREKIRILREATAGFGGSDWDSEPDAIALAEFLDALQAYLPPDTP